MPDTDPRQLQKPDVNGNRGLLRRLRLSESGNVMAIAAVSLIPLIGMIGGAVDISRIYLTKARLQQACDAGVLAGRKSMTGLTWTNDSRLQAEQFFSSNFPEGKYGSGDLSVGFEASSTGAVTGSAEVSVPMTVMKFFNQPNWDVSATCTADLHLPNTDIMLVLDTTRSMAGQNSGDSQTRIDAMRNAVTTFHATLESAKASGSTIRYGFVPYSNTVNVGTLLKADWIADQATYNSREADTPHVQPGILVNTDKTETTGSFEIFPATKGEPERCVAPPGTLQDNTVWSPWVPAAPATPRVQTSTRTRHGDRYTTETGKNGECLITLTRFDNYVEVYTHTKTGLPGIHNPDYDEKTLHWIYGPRTFSMAPLKRTDEDGNVIGGRFIEPNIDLRKGKDPSGFLNHHFDEHVDREIIWEEHNACIEERATRRTNEGSNVPRYDMDVDLVPDRNNPATQWKPYLPGLVYSRQAIGPTDTDTWLLGSSEATRTKEIWYEGKEYPRRAFNFYTPLDWPWDYGACPAPARKFAEMDAGQLQDYLRKLQPRGFTYHDIGFLWGLRLMSPTGLFAAEHRRAEENGSISRHLIFMTDGETDTRIGAYDAWGLSAMDRRRTAVTEIPEKAERDKLTEDRLAELCTLAKSKMNITVWVIAFGDEVTLSPMLANCASEHRAYKASDAEQLNSAFSDIASQIAQLRITG
ncbi:pilus assembly protein [Croceibacterium sp. LX-88]|uniref:Pilus assembly protein n=1 Tax=Croceibacterium selenioxidans TaxID=2838833 RepID=A0ABS5W2V8_9SPHN|nr:TadE/TadG family type IV pilus assembly protein [Croceibacterium selenioxidans]MBT2133672.1 pilus assembly protein [Croceibacterium selenioxidans]